MSAPSAILRTRSNTPLRMPLRDVISGRLTPFIEHVCHYLGIEYVCVCVNFFYVLCLGEGGRWDQCPLLHR